MKRLRFYLAATCLFWSCLVGAQDGANDASFNPTDLGFCGGDGASGSITEMIVQPDGQILIGGRINGYNESLCYGVARVNGNGTIDASFTAAATAVVELRAMALQPDGKVLIGGSFVDPLDITHAAIARLNPDGTLDETFLPMWPGPFPPATISGWGIQCIALQADGRILIGGYFSSYTGISRNNIARLNADGSLDTTFDPGTGTGGGLEGVSVCDVQPDGKILIGGTFGTYNGVARNCIARLNPDGSLDTSLDPGIGPLNGTDFWPTEINALASQPDGRILIGGEFSSFNGMLANHIARLHTDGSWDGSFDTGTGFDERVYGITIRQDGMLLVGGSFSNYDGVPRNRIALIGPDGGLNMDLVPGAIFSGGGDVHRCIPGPGGGTLIAGVFTMHDTTMRNGLALLNDNGTLNSDFNPGSGANGGVYALALQPDGKTIMAGVFTGFNGTWIPRIARLDTNGELDPTFFPGPGLTNGGVDAVLVQPDGKIIFIGSLAPTGIARLNSDGSVDTSFSIVVGSNTHFWALALQSDGKVLIAGHFTSINGIPRTRIARLNPDGSVDVSFNPGLSASSVITAMALQADGKVVIGGDFTSFGGVERNRMARLNADGSLDESFDPGLGLMGSSQNLTPRSIAVQVDGKILIVGGFTAYDGINRRELVKVNSDGSIDNGFDTSPGFFCPIVNGLLLNCRINTVLALSDGKIVISGNFAGYNGFYSPGVARLNADGGFDAGFDVGTGTVACGNVLSTVKAIARQADGKLIIGGHFGSYNGIGRNRIARILNNLGTAIPEQVSQGALLFPNPSTGAFNVRIPGGGPATIIATDITGKVILEVPTQQSTTGSTTIELGDQARGVYLVSVDGPAGRTTERLIVQ